MITIFAKRAYRFHNPDPHGAIVSKPRRDEKPDDAAKRVLHDAGNMGARKDNPAFIDVAPFDIKQVPDWVGELIKTDSVYQHAVKEGNLAILPAAMTANQADTALEIAKAQHAAATADEDDAELQKTAPTGATRVRVTQAPTKTPEQKAAAKAAKEAAKAAKLAKEGAA